MKKFSLAFILGVCGLFTHLAGATQADDTTITITAKNNGPTPFISQLTLQVSDINAIKEIQFTITPRTGSVTRPLSATYSRAYMIERGYVSFPTDEIFFPVYGLYAGSSNRVTLSYRFNDGSEKAVATSILAPVFNDPCGYDNPTVLQARTDSKTLSYDFMLVKNSCDTFSPAIIDTDGVVRWVGSSGIADYTSGFFDNAVYIASGGLYRNDLDGTVTLLASYADLGVTFLHHNIDRGKYGIILDADTATQLESTNIEVDGTGKVLKKWDLGEIISAAMTAGGDDPSQFVAPTPDDWFHNNAVAYNRADDSLIVSSRENFVICLDYETSAIKWILGDPTKKWHQFASLRKFALALAPGTLPPIGQHAPSVSYDQDLLVFDNGENSRFQMPMGDRRLYASPRKYHIDVANNLATEVWNYPQDEMVFSPFCGSVYEDAPLNYLIDYALVNGAGLPNTYAQLLGLDANGDKVFYYQYFSGPCDTAFNSLPLHLESTAFPTVGPKPLNLSTRGLVGPGEDALIGGFIITGTTPKTVILRALGPSLDITGSTAPLADPVLTLFDASGVPIATNDNWQSGPGAGQISAAHLAPDDPAESALIASLPPAAYTAVVTSPDTTPGIGLIEAYDISADSGDSTLANVSTRGSIGTDDEVLISGFHYRRGG